MAVIHDIEKLTDPEIKTEYSFAVENRFEALLELTDEDKRPEELMSQIKDIFLQTAEEKLGKRKGKKKKPWLSSKTFELSKNKREARKRNDKDEYKRLRGEIQKTIRADKREWLNVTSSENTIDSTNQRHFFNKSKRQKIRKFSPRNYQSKIKIKIP